MLWLFGLVMAGVDERDIKEMIDTITPALRTSTKTKLYPAPVARIANRDDIVAAYRARGEVYDDSAIALYDVATNSITLIADVFRSELASAGVPPESVYAVVKCAVAHELIHAAQAERVPNWPSDAAFITLMEGQAQTASKPHCDASVWGHIRARATPVGTLQDNADMVVYANGLRFVDAYERSFGRGATWGLLERVARGEVALNTSQIAEVALAGVPDWRTWRGPEEVFGALRPGDFKTQVARSVGVLAGGDFADHPVAGWVIVEGDTRVSTRIYTAWFEDPVWPKVWVEKRRTALLDAYSWRSMTSVVGEYVQTPPVKRPHRTLGQVDEALYVVQPRGTEERYQELWVARGNLLVGVAHDGTNVEDFLERVRPLLDAPTTPISATPIAELLAPFAPPAP